MRYRKKPIVVEAVQWLPGIPVDGLEEVPAVSALESGDGSSWEAYGIVTTIHGQKTTVQPGDWVITEPDGVHHYPCKPDVFATTYEIDIADDPSPPTGVNP